MSIKKEIDELKLKINSLENIIQKYPDAERHYGRWESDRVIKSAAANSKIDKVFYKHTCGCCYDSSLVVWFYKEEDDGIKIFSNPPASQIAHRDYGNDYYKCCPDDELKLEMNKIGIPQDIINQVLSYVNSICKMREEEVCEDLFDEV